MRSSLSLVPALLATLLVSQALAQRQMEPLGRGLVAIHEGDGSIFLSWRLLGTDLEGTAFNVYRATGEQPPVRINEQPLSCPTHYRDTGVDLSEPTSYFVRGVTAGREEDASRPFRLPANPPARGYVSIPIQPPPDYHANDCSVGDLDGDGEYELVVHMVGRGRDNAHGGLTTEPIFHAYKLDGTLLWTINLGKNIREGAHYAQFIVYDLDGDGRAEMVCKTADGTVDGRGRVIGDPTADNRTLPDSEEPARSAADDSAAAATARAKSCKDLSTSPSSTASPGRLSRALITFPSGAAMDRTGATATATASIDSWRASRIWTAGGRAW